MKRPLRVLIVGAWDHRGRHEEFVYRTLQQMGARVWGLNPARHQSVYHRGPRLFPHLLERWARRLRPHLVLTSKGRGIPPELWASLPGIKVMWYTDYRDPPDPHILALARASDFFFLTAHGQRDQYRRLGVRQVHFLPQAVDHRMRLPASWPKPKAPLAFLGSGYAYRHRWQLLVAFARRFPLHIWGNGWHRYHCPFPPSWCLSREEWQRLRPVLSQVHPPVYNEDFGHVVHRAAIVLGTAIPGVPLYFSNRVWFTLGWGGFLLQEYVEGLETLFENHRHLVWFRTVEEGITLVERYLRYPYERHRIAQEGYRWVHTHHTYHHRLQELLRICGLA